MAAYINKSSGGTPSTQGEFKKKHSFPGFIEEFLRLNLFWLRIMSEHALFIKLGLPCEEVALRSEAEQLQKEFARLLNEAQQIAKNPTKNEVFRLNREIWE
ncbi:MAG: DUF2935 domain-containing protein [Firmicutes bacterium]|nr:DUF2935 domain-containing protein [Bacillota bacterium]